MKDWKTYFTSRLTDAGHFTLEGENRVSETNTLIFKGAKADIETTIHVGIYDDGDLITFVIHNPLTPGFSEQQKREHFYKYHFHPTESYGPPGLEFIEMNIQYFDDLFKYGLEGKEVQYYKEGELIRSEIFQGDGGDEFGLTIKFKKKGFWNTVLDSFKSKIELYDRRKVIDLKEIFHGTN